MAFAGRRHHAAVPGEHTAVCLSPGIHSVQRSPEAACPPRPGALGCRIARPGGSAASGLGGQHTAQPFGYVECTCRQRTDADGNVDCGFRHNRSHGHWNVDSRRRRRQIDRQRNVVGSEVAYAMDWRLARGRCWQSGRELRHVDCQRRSRGGCDVCRPLCNGRTDRRQRYVARWESVGGVGHPGRQVREGVSRRTSGRAICST